MAFSASDAAFEGFRVARRAPMAILLWAVVYAAMLVAFFLVASGSIATLMALAPEMQGGVEPGSAVFKQLMAAYAGMAWFLPIGIVVGAVLNAAVNRAVLEPGARRLGYMRLGMDEVRVWVVSLVLGVLAFVAAFVLFGVAAFLGGLVAMSAGDVGGLIMVVLMIAATGVMIWLLLRFSLAIPITVAEKKFAIFDSWGVTRGRAPGLLGMALIAVVMTIIVSILASIVILPLSLMGIGGIEGLAAMQGASVSEMVSAMGPSLAVYLVFNSLVSALTLALLYAPFAAAYRDISGRGEAAEVVAT